MQKIHLTLDRALLRATDRAAGQRKQTRSTLIRDALREHLRRLEVRALEERDREGYSRKPQSVHEARLEAEAPYRME